MARFLWPTLYNVKVRCLYLSVDVADCYTKRDAEHCESLSSDSVWFNHTCYSYNTTLLPDHHSNNIICPWNMTTASQNCTPRSWLLEQISHKTSATEEYFKYVVVVVVVVHCVSKKHPRCFSL